MDAGDLLRQAKMTGSDYLDAAMAELKEHQYFDQSFDNAMRLAELMAQDFDTMMKYQAMEHITSALERVSESLDHMARSIEEHGDD